MVQLFELLRSSRQRLFISYGLCRDSQIRIGKTQEILEASRQLIERSDALVQRVRPVNDAQTNGAGAMLNLAPRE